MSKSHTLRALMAARLAAATEEILSLFERTIQEYEEELRLSKEETQRTQALLDSLLHPGVMLLQAAAEESPEPGLNHGPNPEIPEPLRIKEEPEEPEEPAVKQEPYSEPDLFDQELSPPELDGSVPESSAVYLKTRDPSLLLQTEHKEETQGTSAERTLICSLIHEDNSNQLQNSHRNIPETRAVVLSGDEPGSHQIESANRLKEYERMLPNAKRYDCDICKKTFSQQFALKKHLEDKPFHCSVCKKPFDNRWDLKLHMKVHAAKKTFNCYICGIGFKLKMDLKCHMRVHRGDSIFSCHKCDKVFPSMVALQSHLSTYTEGAPFSCSVCHRTFNQQSGLRFHMISHTAERQTRLKMPT